MPSFTKTVAALAMAVTATAYSGDVTYYDAGLGACGRHNTNSDMIAAVSHQIFDKYPGAGPNPNKNPICGKKIRVNYGGKSVVVAITDRCGGCNGASDVDLTPTAFKKLAPLSKGRLHGATWNYV